MGRTRPTKGMMLAVNAAIEGEHESVDELIEQHDLDRDELNERLMIREGRKYDFANGAKRRGNTTRQRNTPRSKTTTPAIEVTIDGRTSVRQLFRLMQEAEQVKVRAQQELKRRPDEEIDSVKRALSDIELLRREREKLDQKILQAEDSIW